MIDFTKNQTLTSEQFFAAWEAVNREAAAYHASRFFVQTASKQRLDSLLKAAKYIIFPDAYEPTKHFPYWHERMYKRDFRQWLVDCQIHSFCYEWQPGRYLVILGFSSDGLQYWNYVRNAIYPIDTPANRQDWHDKGIRYS